MVLFADFSTLRALPWVLVAAVLAAVAAPGAADAGKAGAPVAAGGGYDGIWNVLVITQAILPTAIRSGSRAAAFRPWGQPMCLEALAGVALLS